MDFKDLNKKQLILLTLLVTFVVSIATGIITVSLMQQMPKSVPQTINNVIQKTIERVTVAPAEEIKDNSIKDSKNYFNEEVIIPIYQSVKDSDILPNTIESKSIGSGVLISDSGLIMVDSKVLGQDDEIFKVILNNIEFEAKIIHKFSNDLIILQLQSKNSDSKIENTKDSDTKSN